MFLPVKTKEGMRAILNLELVFCFVEQDKQMIAIAKDGAHVALGISYDELGAEIAAMEDGEDDD